MLNRQELRLLLISLVVACLFIHLGIVQRQKASNTTISGEIQVILGQKLSSGADIFLPGDVGYDRLAARYTDFQRPTFSAIVAVASTDDIVEALKYARSERIPFLAQSGGHALAGSLLPIHDAIQINLRRLNNVDFDQTTMLARVGGGVLMDEFINETHRNGRVVTVGSSPCTGLMGVSLGGGLGRLQGLYGHMIDNIVEMTIVLYDGSIKRVSSSKNPDLWWAVRGAGAQFGVVSEALIRTHPQQNNGMHYSADIEYPIAATAGIFTILNRISNPTLPDKLAITIVTAKRDVSEQPAIIVNFVWYGPRDTSLDYLQPFIDLGPTIISEKFVTWDVLPWITYRGLNHLICNSHGGQKNSYSVSLALYDPPVMAKLFQDWIDLNQHYQGDVVFSIMIQTFSPAFKDGLRKDHSSFPWRNGTKHLISLQAVYTDMSLQNEVDDMLKARRELLVSVSGYGRLQQYSNLGHGLNDPIEALYGYDSTIIDRLHELKARYDPEGWFDLYQPIRRPQPLGNQRTLGEKDTITHINQGPWGFHEL